MKGGPTVRIERLGSGLATAAGAGAGAAASGRGAEFTGVGMAAASTAFPAALCVLGSGLVAFVLCLAGRIPGCDSALAFSSVTMMSPRSTVVSSTLLSASAQLSPGRRQLHDALNSWR